MNDILPNVNKTVSALLLQYLMQFCQKASLDALVLLLKLHTALKYNTEASVSCLTAHFGL
jgi:hypothetical protein